MAITHEVLNQVQPLENYNLFESNKALQAALQLHAPDLSGQQRLQLSQLGAQLGSSEMMHHARLANIHTPVLHGHDMRGKRIDQVEFHPSYHELMKLAVSAGLHGSAWAHTANNSNPTTQHAHLVRAAGFTLFTELEPAILCPISMTYAVTPALQANPAILKDWLPLLTSHSYDSRFAVYKNKTGVTMGMGMTEKQGGSDVRANTTIAVQDGSDAWGAKYKITGHKWFFSAPMCDAFLILAQTPAGLSCFFIPRVLPDGSINAIEVQRLKDKLGNKANASSEVEFEAASAWLVGEEGRGIPQILQMGMLTRLDCALGTSGLMRQALSLALNHTVQRQAFGKHLLAHDLMRNVLADLALESEAATALSMRLAHAFGNQHLEHEQVIARVLTPIAKFWICKRGSGFAQEAMECMGGNGYVEHSGDGLMARIYREMPLNSIWEGAGNIMALDLLRALRKADAAGALSTELASVKGVHPMLDRFIQSIPMRIETLAEPIQARRLAQDVALAMQAALLVKTAPTEVYSSFIESRLGNDWGLVYGTLSAHTSFDSIIQRALPH